MRFALVVSLLAAAPALAQPPSDQGPPTGAPGQTPPIAAPGQTPPAQPPVTDPPPAQPKVDPAYGEQPDQTGTGEQLPEDQRHAAGTRRGKPIIVRYHNDRSRQNITMLAVTAGASLVFGAVGVYFNLDARDAADQVSATPTCLVTADGVECIARRTWSPEYQELDDRSRRSSAIAGVAYGIGGALLLTTAIAYIVTEPKLETRIIQPHENGRIPTALVAPTRGGAMVGGTWRF